MRAFRNSEKLNQLIRFAFLLIHRIWHARRQSKNSNQKSFRKPRRPIHHNVCHWPGPLTAKPCSLATVTTPSVYGKCQSRQLVKKCTSLVYRTPIDSLTNCAIIIRPIVLWFTNNSINVQFEYLFYFQLYVLSIGENKIKTIWSSMRNDFYFVLSSQTPAGINYINLLFKFSS